MEVLNRILGVDRVIAAFGCWPTFHDAEVLWMRFDRRAQSDVSYGPSMETLIHVVEGHHALIHLRFQEVVQLQLKWFNFQNLLHGLLLMDARDWQLRRVRWDVRFESTFDINASFQCYEVEVVSVVPCNKSGEPKHAGTSD